ncbi:hypothetical protein Syun_027821 [Stephania yunnanensis]|uniref:Uncharacterized protein n=1 Tax=Stephania yunnanensis TaxID=152371 RepID=A0AAP0HRL3_9MAGN
MSIASVVATPKLVLKAPFVLSFVHPHGGFPFNHLLIVGGDGELGGERPRTEEEGGQPSHGDQKDTTEEVEAAEEDLAALSREESGQEARDHGRGAGRSEAEVSREEVAADQRRSGAAEGER